MVRNIIEIDEKLCNGCGICAEACHEKAIVMVEGKAKLMRDDYCDGLGNCLPACPTGAITMIQREALDFDEKAVAQHMIFAKSGGCPGSAPQNLKPNGAGSIPDSKPSTLQNWPVQIQLAPFEAPYYENARLLVAADCTAFAYPGIHREFMRGRTVLIGCPKLDSMDYAQKLAAILKTNTIRSVEVLRMQVPCCGGLEAAARQAIALCGKDIPLYVETVSVEGQLV